MTNEGNLITAHENGFGTVVVRVGGLDFRRYPVGGTVYVQNFDGDLFPFKATLLGCSRGVAGALLHVQDSDGYQSTTLALRVHAHAHMAGESCAEVAADEERQLRETLNAVLRKKNTAIAVSALATQYSPLTEMYVEKHITSPVAFGLLQDFQKVFGSTMVFSTKLHDGIRAAVTYTEVKNEVIDGKDNTVIEVFRQGRSTGVRVKVLSSKGEQLALELI